jgi:serine/threonine protein kinase
MLNEGKITQYFDSRELNQQRNSPGLGKQAAIQAQQLSSVVSASPTIPTFDPRERYELGGKIGEGGYGYVCQAYDTQRDEFVAVKIIDLEAAQDEVDVHKEIAVMSNLHCPQLTQYYASYVIG